MLKDFGCGLFIVNIIIFIAITCNLDKDVEEILIDSEVDVVNFDVDICDLIVGKVY